MAIDSAEKRRNAAGIVYNLGVTPNVSKDNQWRSQVAMAYSGNLPEIYNVTDSLLIAVTDAYSAILERRDSTDTLSINESETLVLSDTLALTDTLSIAVTDSKAIMEPLDKLDSLIMNLTDTMLGYDTLGRSDSLLIGINESVDPSELYVVTDSLVITITESGTYVNGREPDLVSEVEGLMTTGYLFNKRRTRASRHVGRSRQRERY